MINTFINICEKKQNKIKETEICSFTDNQTKEQPQILFLCAHYDYREQRYHQMN